MTEESDLTAPVGPEDVVTTPKEDTTEGQAPESQTAPPEPEGESEEKKTEAAKRRERDKAYKERLRQEAAEAQARAEKAEAQKRKIVEAGQAEKPPTEAEFPDILDLAAAKALWSLRQQDRTDKLAALDEETAEARKEAEIRQAAEREIIERGWADSVVEAKNRYADFDVVALDRHVPITPLMGELIKASDVGPDVLYWLGQNRHVSAQIAALTSPVEVARAIGRLEASVTMPKARTQTSAPEPIAPVKGTGASVTKDPAKMSYAEFKAYREAGGKL